ncbi:MAG: lysophospholipid acyltransferase family protein [Pseudomonadales bacterium]|jgi:KDO2-lipid IV(A) lauroyltransferase|nr:lysophospholipid acyltransferase family protein [Pseudomonadales bacterium]
MSENTMMSQIVRWGLWLAQLPSPRLATRLAALTARFLLIIDSDAAKISRVNIQLCFPKLSEREVSALVRQSLADMVLLVFEFAQMTYWSEQELMAQIQSVEGESLLKQAYNSDRGVLLLVPHFGNWELLCAFLGLNYSFAALYAPPKVAALEPAILATRERFGGELFAIDTAGMRSILRVLKKGKLVAILPDQVPDRSAGVYADFFGHPALTMSLVHRLIDKTAPDVIIGSVQRKKSEDGCGYVARFESLVESIEGLDAQGCAEVLNRSIERVVRRAPEQYQWEYKRFKRPPSGGRDNVYRRQ